MNLRDRIHIEHVTTLSDDWFVLKKTQFNWQRTDGQWQRQSRETYDRGHGAVLLAYNLVQGTVLLVKQFRYPAFVTGYPDLLIEAPAGLLDDDAPEVRIRAEVEEETGYRLGAVRKVFEAFMSPGSVTERLHFFVAEYDSAMQVSDGGGLADEGEEIQVLELPLPEALTMVADGRICDAKTIMLLQYVALHRLTPNEATIAAMRDARAGNVVAFSGVDALMADLKAKDGVA
jgi:nudix-type nucleoside diphosphatase (YffH/AdpP family)